MDSIRSWAVTVCIAAIVITVMRILVPKGNVSRTFEIVLRVFLLSILVLPVLFTVDFKEITRGNFESQIEEYSQLLEAEVSSMLEEELSLQIEETIKVQLSEIGVNINEIVVEVKASGSKEAEIESVYVRIDSIYKIKDAEIRYVISKNVKCEIKIKYEEEI